MCVDDDEVTAMMIELDIRCNRGKIPLFDFSKEDQFIVRNIVEAVLQIQHDERRVK